jgi:hypothetical protein
MRFFTYDEMRVFLRSYFRHFMEWQYPRSTHPSMRFMALVLGLTIKKERV